MTVDVIILLALVVVVALIASVIEFIKNLTKDKNPVRAIILGMISIIMCAIVGLLLTEAYEKYKDNKTDNPIETSTESTIDSAVYNDTEINLIHNDESSLAFVGYEYAPEGFVNEFDRGGGDPKDVLLLDFKYTNLQSEKMTILDQFYFYAYQNDESLSFFPCSFWNNASEYVVNLQVAIDKNETIIAAPFILLKDRSDVKIVICNHQMEQLAEFSFIPEDNR